VSQRAVKVNATKEGDQVSHSELSNQFKHQDQAFYDRGFKVDDDTSHLLFKGGSHLPHPGPIDQPVQDGGAYQEIVDTSTLPSIDIGIPGVSLKVLYTDPATGAEEVITHLDPGAVIPEHFHTFANETVYVLDGDFVEGGVSYGPGTLT
jgi:hypothetical protein